MASTSRIIRFISIILIEIIVVAPIVARAASTDKNYYIAGYFYSLFKATTPKAIMGVNVPNVELWRIPYGRFIAAVLSVAGGHGNNPSGCVYQIGVAILRDGRVVAAPQVWYLSHNVRYKGIYTGVDVDAIAWYVEIQVARGVAVMRIYVYDNWAQFEHNYPTIKEVRFSLAGTPCSGDSNLLVGTDYVGGKLVNFLQFGIEASAHVEGSWEIQTYSMAYYKNGHWYYLPAWSTLGQKSYITYVYEGGKPHVAWVGGDDYAGANIGPYGSDYVFWRYTGTTLPEGTPLWSDFGEIVPYPYLGHIYNRLPSLARSGGLGIRAR